MIGVSAFDVLDQLRLGFEIRVRLFVEQVQVFWVIAQDLQGHFHWSDLEFYYEVHEDLVLVLFHVHCLTVLPELLCDPIGYDWHMFQILNERLHVFDLLRKYSWEGQLTPRGSLFIFID